MSVEDVAIRFLGQIEREARLGSVSDEFPGVFEAQPAWM